MIHCTAGVSRSVTIVIAFLIKTNGWSYDKVFIKCGILSLVKMGYIVKLVKDFKTKI
jgi:hypothetical protein